MDFVRRLDPLLLIPALALMAFGIVMVYSASFAVAEQRMADPYHFLKKQAIAAAIGVVLLLVAARVHYRLWQFLAIPLLLLTVALLGALILPGMRHEIGGSSRWLKLGSFSFQPAELAKLALVIYLAYSLAKKAEKVRSFTVGFVPHMIVCGLMMALLLKQPDLGTAVILGMATLILLFVAGAKISYIFIAFLAAAPVMYQAIVGTPWRLRRMLAFLD
ncbi:MAG TPA: FtsW/RodA/SpoVE family cell cycle protein, partial [Thermodesulfobacteriota bacterium]|nr:FtsW/RodA/SpoVE family cell cycle protein [Thermodesulfobacteriota bacterium]